MKDPVVKIFDVAFRNLILMTMPLHVATIHHIYYDPKIVKPLLIASYLCFITI